jgi:hypothetical protein
MHLKESESEDVGMIQVAQEKIQWRALTKTAMFSTKVVKLLTG